MRARDPFVSPILRHPCVTLCGHSVFRACPRLSCVHRHLYDRFGAADAARTELPSTLVWALYFLAQHHDRVGEYAAAMAAIDKAIAHTPTVVDFYMAKAKIFKHCGNYAGEGRLRWRGW